MQAYSVPCWWEGWWLWRTGCISQDTYLLYTRKVPITELTDRTLSSRTAQLLCPPALLDAVLVGERHPSERGNLIKVFYTGIYFDCNLFCACTLLQNFSIWLHCWSNILKHCKLLNFSWALNLPHTLKNRYLDNQQYHQKIKSYLLYKKYRHRKT